MNEALFVDGILDGAAAALIDQSIKSSADFRPQFLTNDYTRGQKVLSTIETELSKCSAFDFSVAFVTMGGITPMLQLFKELETKGTKGRILTTDYLAFSEPVALEVLNRFSNIEVRFFQTESRSDHVGFHTKGYLFTYPDGYQKAIIGSSNLTSAALSLNKEWNLQFTSLEHGGLICDIRNEFDALWNASLPLDDVLETYKEIYKEKKRVIKSQTGPIDIQIAKLEPNSMQTAFLSSLKRIVEQNEKRALLISATGTGKTYAAAFAMRHFEPKHVLFLAHREQLLKQSKRSFERVLGNTKTYGLLSGNSHITDKDYLFATVQTMSKDEYLYTFDRDEFDYIVVDEVHRAGANSYQKILDYFTPKFCLGMTASPDRPDGIDIYKLFDNQIAYEIRLQSALENGLLCPFHYFGITELAVDGEEIEDGSDFNRLTCDARVNHIIEQAELYGHSGDRVKGLIFCSRKDEAKKLSEKFNVRGYSTCFLSGENSQQERERQIERLESDDIYDKLDYIFTVDIFNEGVDIPSVNQVIMLRPTESPIIFVQQLGRGLRKADGKEYVVVLDFIGNYTNNYMIPIALSGDRSYNKDSIRKYVMEGSRVIPGCSTVHFDEISRARIFESIDNSTISLKFLKEKYATLKYKLGRIPRMTDFLDHGEIDPLLIAAKGKPYKSYYAFLSQYESEWKDNFSKEEHLVLEYLSTYIINGKRPHELLLLKELLDKTSIQRDKLEVSFYEYSEHKLSDKAFESIITMLDKSFVSPQATVEKYEPVSFIEYDGSHITRSESLTSMISQPAFRDAFSDLIEYGLQKYENQYRCSNDGFVLYEKYGRRDVCRLLNWPHDDSATVYGYQVKHGTCPIFVTYNKSDEITASTQYADKFDNQRIFSWKTRSRLTLASPEVQKIINADKTGLDIRLFIKKSDYEGTDFYYFGKVHPTSQEQSIQLDDKGNELPIVTFKFELENPVRDDIYAYFEGPTDVEILASAAS